MRSRWLLLLSLTIAAPAAARADANPLQRSRQCLVVMAANWNSTTGVLHAFERNNGSSSWKAHGAGVPVVLGKKGLAWGRGLVNTGAGPIKMEGDNKAPAGVFRLGQAFGYTRRPSARWVKLRYLPLTNQIEGIDDPRSRYYNRLVDRSTVARVDWRTSEKMLRDDDLYKWGVVVEHNTPPRAGAGSCIFLHVWENSSTATAGCTAMPERELVKLLRWLDPVARPILVQMPSEIYGRLRSKYNLPPD